MAVRRTVTKEELKRLKGFSQKATIRDELLSIQLTQAINVSGVQINPKSTMFKSGNRGTPITASPEKAGQANRKEG